MLKGEDSVCGCVCETHSSTCPPLLSTSHITAAAICTGEGTCGVAITIHELAAGPAQDLLQCD